MKRIAIIGSGISGLVCAWKLSQTHHVTVFEKNDYVGGHTHTVSASVSSGTYAIDTGFIVCNDRTYPAFLKLLDEWGVQKQKTEMSFSVSCAASGLEYNGTTFNSLFAQRANLFSPRFWSLLAGIIKLNKKAKIMLAREELSADATLQDFLDQTGVSGLAVSHYLRPMTAAIWSTPLTDVKRFPLQFFLQFCDNHGLFNINDRPQWYTIKGGSHQYIQALQKKIGLDIRLKQAVNSVTRLDSSVEIRLLNGECEKFDEVIFACHSDEALAMLSDASREEKEILSAIRYQENDVILHCDTSLLPINRRAWAAWNYWLPLDDKGLPTLTYNMNILQNIAAPETFCVTLNRADDMVPDQILGRFRYAHPQFDAAAVRAQTRHSEISGKRRTHYCGAYWRYGFHEDGVQSALSVVRGLLR